MNRIFKKHSTIEYLLKNSVSSVPFGGPVYDQEWNQDFSQKIRCFTCYLKYCLSTYSCYRANYECEIGYVFFVLRFFLQPDFKETTAWIRQCPFFDFSN